MYNDKSFVSSHSSHINNNNNCNKIRRFMSIFFKNVWLFGSNIHCIAWNRSDLGDNKKLSEINRCKKDNTHTHTPHVKRIQKNLKINELNSNCTFHAWTMNVRCEKKCDAFILHVPKTDRKKDCRSDKLWIRLLYRVWYVHFGTSMTREIDSTTTSQQITSIIKHDLFDNGYCIVSPFPHSGPTYDQHHHPARTNIEVFLRREKRIKSYW